LAQARKKAVKAVRAPSRLIHHLRESAFLLSILVAVYLVACLFTYDPNDPGPFNTTNSDHVQNAGRILGAWLADAFLGLSGFVAYLLPVITVYGGWRVLSNSSKTTETTAIQVIAVVTGLALFLLSSTGLSFMHLMPPAGSMPAGGGGVIGDVVATPMMQLTGQLGSTLFLFSMMLVGVTLFTGLSWFHVMDVTGRITLDLFGFLLKQVAGMRDWFAGRRARAQREVVRKTDSVKQKGRKAPKIEPQISIPQEQPSKRVAREKQRPLFKDMPADSLPPLDMLDEPHDQPPGYSEDALKALSKQPYPNRLN
jgi:S-DNA-T family DNA segregation ATPase FtsK/SpoIIIE